VGANFKGVMIMDHSTVDAIAKLGLGVSLGIGCFYMLFWIIRFILTKMVSVLEKMIQSIEKHTQEQSESHAYQKKEHETMIKNQEEITKTLTRINGYKN